MWAAILSIVTGLFGVFLKKKESTAEELGGAKAQLDVANQNAAILNAEAQAQVKTPCSNAAMIDLLDKGKL